MSDQKKNNRNIFTVGGYRIDYPGEVATPTSDMLVAQILFNNVISKKRARFMIIDISNLYLMTQLKRPEYICIHVKDIPYEIIKETKLK